MPGTNCKCDMADQVETLYGKHNFVMLSYFMHLSSSMNLGPAADFTKCQDQSYLDLGRVTCPNLGWVQYVLTSIDTEPNSS